MVSFSLVWIQSQDSNHWQVTCMKEDNSVIAHCMLPPHVIPDEMLSMQNQNFQRKETEENKVLGI